MAAQFSWAAAGDVGLGLAGAYGQIASAQAGAIVSKANADAQNVIRKAQNEQRASGLSLAATMRGITDKRILDQAGDASNAAAEVLARTQQSWLRGNVEQGLRDMEHLGAVTARASAAGVGGGSVAAVSFTQRLQQARAKEQVDQRQGQMTYELIKQRSGIMSAAESRLDISPLSANQDFTTNSAPAGGGGNLMAALTEGLLSKSKSLQVALDSIHRDATVQPGQQLPTTSTTPAYYEPIVIN
jgi:hypothetical protein